MSKFKIKLKLTGLEIEIEGTKEDLPIISQNLANQLGNVITPAANMVQGARPAIPHIPAAPGLDADETKSRRKSPRKNGGADTKAKKAVALDFVHDSSKWGTPSQDWNPTKKSLWLLYVVKAAGAATEMTATEVANTFNKHFRQAGTIQPSNVSRDLGKAKKQAPALVGEMTNQDPSPWFLTAEGEKIAIELVREGLGQKTSPNA